jgi:lysozyme
MKLSAAGISAIEEREGTKAQMYLDQAGLPTIGVGHLLTKSELSSGKILFEDQAVAWHLGLAPARIAQLFARDSAWAEETVNAAVRVPLTQNQYDALVSFVYNIGAEAFTQPTRQPQPGCTLLRLLNAGQYIEVPDQLRRWVYTHGGHVDPILVKRRQAEAEQWLTP